MSYAEFKQEVENRRGIILFISPMMLSAALNPEEMDAFSSFGNIRKFSKWQCETIAASDKEDDHPMVVEMKRRLIDIIEEARECGLF